MSSRPTVREWLAARDAPVPLGFQAWMNPAHPDAPASPTSLVAEAVSALRRAEEPTGRPRQGAFDLLVADGYATWACEAALDESDAVEALRRVVDALLE